MRISSYAIVKHMSAPVQSIVLYWFIANYLTQRVKERFTHTHTHIIFILFDVIILLAVTFRNTNKYTISVFIHPFHLRFRRFMFSSFCSNFFLQSNFPKIVRHFCCSKWTSFIQLMKFCFLSKAWDSVRIIDLRIHNKQHLNQRHWRDRLIKTLNAKREMNKKKKKRQNENHQKLKITIMIINWNWLR